MSEKRKRNIDEDDSYSNVDTKLWRKVKTESFDVESKTSSAEERTREDRCFPTGLNVTVPFQYAVIKEELATDGRNTNLQHESSSQHEPEMTWNTTAIKEELWPEEQDATSSQQRIKLEPTMNNLSIKSEPMDTSSPEQNQDFVSQSPDDDDDDDDEREFQQFRLRMAQRMDAREQLQDTLRGIQNHQYCTNVKDYLNRILENLPPEQYRKTALMTEDPFFAGQIGRVLTDPCLKTVFALLHRRGVITREDMCCILHPLNSDSTMLFNLIEVLKRKPNGRTAIETAVRDCLSEELLGAEDSVDVSRINQPHALCFEDLANLECFFERKHVSEIENWRERRYSFLHYAAADGNLALYKQLECLFIGAKEDQDKNMYIQGHRDAQKGTVLHVAVQYGSDEVCGYLCRKYPQLIKSRDILNQEPIHIAVIRKNTNTNCYKYLLAISDGTNQHDENVVDMATKQKMQRVLSLVYKHDNATALKYIFLKYPSLKNYKRIMGRLPIHFAAECDGLECFRYLEQITTTDLGRDLVCDDITRLTDDQNSNVLHIACEAGSLDVIGYLIHQYPDLLFTKGRFEREPIHYSIHGRSSYQTFVKVLGGITENTTTRQTLDYLMESTSNKEHSVLHQACRLGKTDIITYVFERFPFLKHCERYPSLNGLEGYDGTDLILSAAMADGTFECFQYILNTVTEGRAYEDQIQYLSGRRDDAGRTVFHLACLFGRKNIVECLLTKYPSLISLKGSKGGRAIHDTAYGKGSFECFTYVLGIALQNKSYQEQLTYLKKTRDDTGRTVLHVACLNGKTEIVKHLLTKYPVLIGVKGHLGRHPMHETTALGESMDCFQYVMSVALQNKNEREQLDYLIKSTDDNDKTILHIACSYGRKDIVEYLLTRYPSLIDEKGCVGRQPLHEATNREGSFECFKYVLDNKLQNKNYDEQLDYLNKTRDDYNMTTFHLACMYGRRNIVAYLLHKYPSLISVTGCIGRLPIQKAASKEGSLECFLYIMDIVLQSKNVEERLDYLSKTRDDYNMTVLHIACSYGRRDIVEYLLKQFPSLLDENGFMKRKPIHDAADCLGSLECFQYILDTVFKNKTLAEQLDYLETTRDEEDDTVLHIACQSGRKDIAKYLLTKYPSLIGVNGHLGRLPVHSSACENGSLECFQYLLYTSCPRRKVMDRIEYVTNMRDDRNDTILHIACSDGRKDVVQFLIRKYPPLIDLRGSDGMSVLHSAATKFGNLKCFQYILRVLNRKRKMKDEQLKILESILDGRNNTVQALAKKSGRNDIVKFLAKKYKSLR